MYESYESGPRLCEVARRNLCDSSSGSNGYYDTGGDPEVKANILVNGVTAEVVLDGGTCPVLRQTKHLPQQWVNSQDDDCNLAYSALACFKMGMSGVGNPSRPLPIESVDILASGVA